MNKIAWIGLGNMGIPMARNLATQENPVVVYNRSPKGADYGRAKRAETLRDTVTGADVIFVMVSDGAAVRSVLFDPDGAVQWMEPGALVVNMSTIGVDETKAIALELANHGHEFMDAPVSGSVGAAEEAKLVILAGGTESAFHRVEPLFLKMGKSAHHLGDIGSGAAMKLLVNAYLGVAVEAAAECMAVADKSGLGRGRFLDVLSESAMWSPILAAKQPLWLKADYPAAFALKHMTKDLGLMAHYATMLSAATPAVLSALGVYLAAQANDLAEEDMAGIASQLNQQTGLS